METQLIKVIWILLGVTAPVVILYSVSHVIQSSTWKNKRKHVYWTKIVFGVVIWAMLVFGLAFTGLFGVR